MSSVSRSKKVANLVIQKKKLNLHIDCVWNLGHSAVCRHEASSSFHVILRVPACTTSATIFYSHLHNVNTTCRQSFFTLFAKFKMKERGKKKKMRWFFMFVTKTRNRNSGSSPETGRLENWRTGEVEDWKTPSRISKFVFPFFLYFICLFLFPSGFPHRADFHYK